MIFGSIGQEKANIQTRLLVKSEQLPEKQRNENSNYKFRLTFVFLLSSGCFHTADYFDRREKQKQEISTSISHDL